MASRSVRSRKLVAVKKNVEIKSTSTTKKSAARKISVRKKRISRKASPGGIALIIEPGQGWVWQNSRPYHENGDLVFLNTPFPNWEKPVRAMANGVVLHFENKIPNNWKPDGSDAGMEKQKDELWGAFDYGGSGNHFYIKHGNVVALYAHLQKGSLNPRFAKNGAVVKKGDFLGKAGNSGNSSGPHLHIHIKTFKNSSEPEGGIFRPLLFNNGYVIGQANYPKPKSNVNWTGLNKQGIPGLKRKACFIHPSDTHPYCAYPTNWGEVCRRVEKG